jgi:hypothetical protein
LYCRRFGCHLRVAVEPSAMNLHKLIITHVRHKQVPVIAGLDKAW